MTATRALTLKPMEAGLNNQKFALIGLCRKALSERRPVVLPQLVDFDFRLQGQTQPLVGIFDIFDKDHFEGTLREVGVSLVEDAEAEVLDGWIPFGQTTNHFGKLYERNQLRPDELACRLLSAYASQPRIADLSRSIVGELVARGVTVGCQLRVERDWAAYIENRLRAKVGLAEDLTVDPMRILQKVKATFPACNAVFVTADEKNLPFEIDTLSERVRAEIGLELVWKNSLSQDLRGLPNLALAQLDFDVASRFPAFVGTTRSTFFNMVALSRFVSGDSQAYAHYAYNVSGGRLRRRTDHGGAPSAVHATRVAGETPAGGGAVGPSTPSGFHARYAGHVASGWSDAYDPADSRFVTLQASFADAGGLPGKPIFSDRTYFDVLKALHAAMQPSTYLEIGPNQGAALPLASAAARIVYVGKKPRTIPAKETSALRTVVKPADRFFAEDAPGLLRDAPADLCLIDGLNVFEYALRSFIGCERHAARTGAVAIINVLPRTLAEASRFRMSGSWAGDVWRLLGVLEHFRPDLAIAVDYVRPTGLAVVRRLDPDSTVLTEYYEEAVRFGLALGSRDFFVRRDEIVARLNASALAAGAGPVA